MHAPARPYVMAGVALAATSLVAVTPTAPRLPEMPVTSLATRLLSSGDSILNIPINLFYDLVNIPYNEIHELDTLAGSLFMTGNWYVPGATNIWGIDPGDSTHVAAILGVLPFPALTQGYGGLEYQVDGLLAAELPVNASCDAETCFPILPSPIVTGITSIDHSIGFGQALTGPFGLFDNWLKVPLFGPDSLTSGYYFDPSAPGSIDPSGPAYAGFGFPQTGGAIPNPFEGGTTLVNGENVMPWAGQTFTLNLLQPFENFYNSLLATPPTDGIFGTGFELPTLTGLLQGLQAVAAGLVVDFYPWTPGSPACPAECVAPFGPPLDVTIPEIVKALDPTHSNPLIQEWLTAVANGMDNNATPIQIQDAVSMLSTGVFTLPPTELAQINADLAAINPVLPAIAADSGWLAGYNPDQLIIDIQQLLGGGVASASSSLLSPDLFTPTLPADLFGTLPTDLSSQLSADLSTLLANFGTNLPAFFSTLSADLLSLF